MSNNKLADKFPKPYEWECVYNHMPKWVEKLDTFLHNIMPVEERKRVDGLLNRFNDLTDEEEKRTVNDPHSVYGIDNEKQELTESLLKIYEKYRKDAEELSRIWDDADDDDSSVNKILHSEPFQPHIFGFRKKGMYWQREYEVNGITRTYFLDMSDRDGYLLWHEEPNEPEEDKDIVGYNGIIPTNDFFALIEKLSIYGLHPKREDEE